MAAADATVKHEGSTPTRRMHLWWKHSVVSASAGQPSFHPSKEAYNDMPEFPMCRNIDEALHSFRVEEEFSNSRIVDEYDWVLDGRKDDDYHARRSRELINEMKVPDVEDVVLIRDIIWEASQRELQFASFTQEEENDDVFGDFQAADVCKDAATNSNNEVDNEAVVNIEDITDKEANEEEKKTDSRRSVCVKQGVVGDVNETAVVEQGVAVEVDDDDDSETISIPMEVKVTCTESDYSLDVLSCSSHEDEVSKEVDEWDLTTPEGRFLRRQLAEQSPAPISLPQHFFQEAGSMTLCEAVVRSIPWKHVPFVQKDFKNTSSSENDMAVVEEHLMSQLMQLDGWLASVTTQSLEQISYHKNSLELCNHHLRELNHSLAMADMYAQQSKKSLTDARGDECTGLTSAMVLLEAWDQQDVYRDLDSLLTNCANLLDQEMQLEQKIKAFGQDTSQLEDIIEAARLFSENAHEDEQLSKLTALDHLRDRANQIVGTFSRQVESLVLNLVAGTCVSWKKFCPTQYGDFFNAIVRIHQEEDQKDTVAETWTKCIVDTLLFEADKCLARALLNPTNGGESAHDKELLTLEYALQEGHGDYAKLKTVSHNLVTIRFDFEADHNYFPLVFHRLCLLLTDVLYCHYTIVKWHKGNTDQDKEVHKQIRRQLLKSKLKVWKRCEHVLVTCMDEYLNFASKSKLFDDKTNESRWINDLEAMHDVMQLTQQLCIIGKDFLGKDAKQKVTCLSDETCDTALRSKLCSVHRKHLRAVHVESMNSMGSMLSKESWQLVPMHPVTNGLIGFCSSESELKAYMAKLVDDFMIMPQTNPQAVKICENRVQLSNAPFFPLLEEAGNPFDVLPAGHKRKKHGVIDHDHPRRPRLQFAHEGETTDEISRGLYDLLAAMVDNNLTEESRIAIDTCFVGFAKCIARLLLVMDKLPLVLLDATRVLQNVSDLLLTTVFRLCTGNSVNESIVLGAERAKQFVMDFPTGKRKNPAPLIGFGRRSAPEGPTRPHQPMTSRLEAEICSPLLCDKEDADLLKNFIHRAQLSLEGMVKLDMIQGWIGDPVGIAPEESDDEYLCKVCTCLEKRQAASWSCVFVAAMLDLVKHFAVTRLTNGTLTDMLGESPNTFNNKLLNGVSCLVDYVDSVLTAVPRMIRFSTKMASARAIGSRRIVEEICRAEWDTSRLSESPHYYVELVCGRYAFIWRFLSTSAKLPIGIRRHTWESLVAIGYSTFLEGFARVPYCSTEGRSSMSMDLAAFAAGVSPSSIEQVMDNDCILRPPSTASQARGGQYVDTYIKVSYFPHDDIMTWIASNFSEYHLNHCIALTGGRADLIKYVERLYYEEIGKVEG